MPIRNVVTRGLGNGTYSPGVSFLATRGYSIAELVQPRSGPVVVAALAAYQMGPKAIGTYQMGPLALGTFQAGPAVLAGVGS